MTKKVAIILANEFEDIEYSSPKEALENAGFNTVVIGDTANSEVVGKHGEKVTVDVGIAEAKPEDYDALLIPGGFSPDHLRGDTEGRYGTFDKSLRTFNTAVNVRPFKSSVSISICGP